MQVEKKLLSINEAATFASHILARDISSTNISYLIQYGKIKKYGENGNVQINIEELKEYYKSRNGKRELNWKKRLGNDINWGLSFEHLREKDTTKHVHRLHPYKGKFIPQLVEYFLDDHIDNLKTNVFFKKGDIILDPFCGSGTMLVQANELGMHSIGIDVSQFNCAITNAKLLNYDFELLTKEVAKIKCAIQNFESNNNVQLFEKELVLNFASSIKLIFLVRNLGVMFILEK